MRLIVPTIFVTCSFLLYLGCTDSFFSSSSHNLLHSPESQSTVSCHTSKCSLSLLSFQRSKDFATHLRPFTASIVNAQPSPIKRSDQKSTFIKTNSIPVLGTTPRMGDHQLICLFPARAKVCFCAYNKLYLLQIFSFSLSH